MKIWAFVAEIFAKQYWCFLIIDFQCIFDISAIMHLRSLQRMIITEWLWNFFETRSQNLPISVKWKHQSQLIFCIIRLSQKHIDFDSSQGTPCIWGIWLVRYQGEKQYQYQTTKRSWSPNNQSRLSLTHLDALKMFAIPD